MAAIRETRAAVLCPGPSLARALPEIRSRAGAFDLVLAVNRAAKAHPCDGWVCLDLRSYLKVDPAGRPRLVTSRKRYRQATARRPELRAHGFTDIGAFPVPQDLPWRLFSAPAALVAARAMAGAREIVVFGADMAGEADWEGQTAERRDERRWKCERETWRHVAAWLDAQGVAVHRWNALPLASEVAI